MTNKIPSAVIRRLPRYYRFVEALCSRGVTRVSSRELAAELGFTASQVRQDFSCFGGFGQQGYGYNTESLRSNLSAILKLQNGYRGVLIGVGNLGLALLHNFDFAKSGLRLIATFDVLPEKVGTSVSGLPVLHSDTLEDFCREHKPDIAVLTCPSAVAQTLAQRLVDLGVAGLWNFTNIDLAVGEGGTVVENVHFSDSLMTLCCRVPRE